MNQKVAANDAADVASPEDKAKLERQKEKHNLLIQIAILEDRKEAIGSIIDDRKARLQSLMMEDGERKITFSENSAGFTVRRSFKVVDHAKLAKLFSRDVLAEHFHPTAAFVEAAEKTNVNLTGVINTGSTSSFSFQRPQSAEAVKARERFIEQTKREAEDTVARLTAKILSAGNRE